MCKRLSFGSIPVHSAYEAAVNTYHCMLADMLVRIPEQDGRRTGMWMREGMCCCKLIENPRSHITCCARRIYPGGTRLV